MKVEIIFNDVLYIPNKIHEDSRGSFSEIFTEKMISDLNIPRHFIQENLSYSRRKGTIRGLHYQKKPSAQAKLIKVINGEIEDFFIDLRKNSSTYQEYKSFVLDKNSGWLYIPVGFAHGFCTLKDDTTVLYKVDNYYSKKDEGGIIWNDNFFNISWPISGIDPFLSDKDKSLPLWKSIRDEVDF